VIGARTRYTSVNKSLTIRLALSRRIVRVSLWFREQRVRVGINALPGTDSSSYLKYLGSLGGRLSGGLPLEERLPARNQPSIPDAASACMSRASLKLAGDDCDGFNLIVIDVTL
jgi:hypothetical protein